MGDGIGERFQLLVGGFKFYGAFGDASFQIFVQLADLSLRPLAVGDVAEVGRKDRGAL